MAKDDYKKYLAPGALVTIIFSLIAVIYTNLKDVNTQHANLIQALQREKVDNQTLQTILGQQKQLMKAQKENFNRLYDEIKDFREKLTPPGN